MYEPGPTSNLSAIIGASTATVGCHLKNLDDPNLKPKSNPDDLTEALTQQRGYDQGKLHNQSSAMIDLGKCDELGKMR